MPWELDDGFRSDYDFAIHAANFSPHAEYQDGQVLLLNLIGVDESDNQDITESMSVGGDWQTPDGGKTIIHPTKDKLHKSSRYGRWLTCAMSIPDLLQVLQSRGDPTEAAIWEGLRIHVKRTAFPNNRADINNGQPFEWNMPTAYLGLTSAPSPTTVASPQQQMDLPSAVSQLATPSSNGTPLEAQVIAAAAQSSDFGSFVNAAFQIQGVSADDDLTKRVLDSTSGIFPTVKKG